MKDWFWEGNVQESLICHLQDKGWCMVSTSNTASKERGIDIHASKDEKILLIEVKGYPSKGYSDPRRANEKKKTSSSLQAVHWYSHALLKAMRLQARPFWCFTAKTPRTPREFYCHCEERSDEATQPSFIDKNGLFS